MGNSNSQANQASNADKVSNKRYLKTYKTAEDFIFALKNGVTDFNYCDFENMNLNRIIFSMGKKLSIPKENLHKPPSLETITEHLSQNIEKIPSLKTQINRSFFKGCSLRGSNLNGVFAQGANFENVNANVAVFDRSHLCGATFDGASIEHASFIGAKLGKTLGQEATSFRIVNAKNADFTGADLTDANFQESDVTNANFTKACLQGAIFTNATLGGKVEDFLANKLAHHYLSGDDFSMIIGEKPFNTNSSESLRNISNQSLFNKIFEHIEKMQMVSSDNNQLQYYTMLANKKGGDYSSRDDTKSFINNINELSPKRRVLWAAEFNKKMQNNQQR